MKKTLLIILALSLAIPFTFTMAFAGNLEEGTLSGGHYNLNLLGKNNCPGDDLKGGNRHTIFVKLYYSDPDPNSTLGDVECNADSESPDCLVNLDKRNKIFLTSGSAFQVTDGNACDGDGAWFTLPSDVATAWDIYVRELGKPGGTGDIVTCGINDNGTPGNISDDEIVCSMVNVPLERKTGKSIFRNVTRELTTIDYRILIGYDASGNPIYDYETANLFDPDFYRYFWDYDNNGLRLVQLRFYPAAQ